MADFAAALLDQLLCLEEAPQVEDLPCSQPNETAHGEYAEVQHACVGGLWRGEKKYLVAFCSYHQVTNEKL